jgi:cold shock CspA family protein
LKKTIYLEKGEKVEFTIKKTKRGPMAINVRPIN